MQTTYHAAKAIEDHLFDAARRSAPKRLSGEKLGKTGKAWSVRATRPVVNPS